GTTRNMASPALASLNVEFFYTRSSALCALFLEMFSWEVPKTIVCLTATALQAAIDEYMVTEVQQDHHFKSGTYSQVFTQLMGMQAKIDANPKHATMTCALRVGWATR
ncbi:hypothetical protein SCLCIDRAFT_132066, partial [Scleroderma citrinum Foug A]